MKNNLGELERSMLFTACVCMDVCNYIKFYECFLSLETVCVYLYACR